MAQQVNGLGAQNGRPEFQPRWVRKHRWTKTSPQLALTSLHVLWHTYPPTLAYAQQAHTQSKHTLICYQGRITMNLSKLNTQHDSLKYPSMKTTLLKFGNVFTTDMTGNAVRTLNQGFWKAVHKARTVVNK